MHTSLKQLVDFKVKCNKNNNNYYYLFYIEKLPNNNPLNAWSHNCTRTNKLKITRIRQWTVNLLINMAQATKLNLGNE